MTWYAITVKEKPIRAVRKMLRRAGVAAYLPAHARRIAGRKRRAVSPLMQYIFVRAPSPDVTHLWMHHVLSIKFVRGFVGTQERGAVAIADEKINFLKLQIRLMMLEARAAQTRRRVEAGKSAVIKSGHLAGRRGTVVWTNGVRAKIEAELFGTGVIEVAVESLEAA